MVELQKSFGMIPKMNQFPGNPASKLRFSTFVEAEEITPKTM